MEIKKIIKGNEVDKNSSLYQKLLYLAELINSPVNYIEKDSPATINYYGGNDDAVGLLHYSLLKNKYYEVGYGKDAIIYARYNNHSGSFDASTESGKIALEEFTTMFKLYTIKYFDKIQK